MIIKLAVVFKYFILDILTESKFHNLKISGFFFFNETISNLVSQDQVI